MPKTGQPMKPDPENQPYLFKIGDTVKITGLTRCPEYNKAQGLITDLDPLMCRWLVSIGGLELEQEEEEGTQQLWIRPANLIQLTTGQGPQDYIDII